MRKQVALVAAVWVTGSALPAAGMEPVSELYFRGDIGISFSTGDVSGFNIPLDQTNSGEDDDASPVFGVAVGATFPLNRAMPWRWRAPRMRIPYWPGRVLYTGEEETGFPDWPVSFEVEHLRGRNFDFVTRGVAVNDPYRSEVDAWTTMANFRVDFPVRPTVQKLLGRMPLLDPLTLYLKGGAGMGKVELDAGLANSTGDEEVYEFAWQAGAGFGYQLNEWVRWDTGWRYLDLGKADTPLRDNGVPPTRTGRYSADVTAHEFTTALTFAFWRVSFFGDD